jgi:hypothetical protein
VRRDATFTTLGVLRSAMSAMVTFLSPISWAKAKAGWGSKGRSAPGGAAGICTTAGDFGAAAWGSEARSCCAQPEGQYATKIPTQVRNKAMGANLCFMGLLQPRI